MKVLVIGSGLQGFEITRDLSRNVEVGVVDVSQQRLNKCKEELKITSLYKIDARESARMIKLMKKFDVIVGALPPGFGFELLKMAIEAGVDIVDISFMPENPLELDDFAKKKGVKVVPDCGLAPGLSNILVGHAVSKLKKVDEIHIKAGGLPQRLSPPLDYKVVFSLESVIEEYTRRARIVKNGKAKEVEPLSGLEEVEFKEIGKFECFYTDGLRTLLSTIREVKDMDEKTIRYPSHAEKIRTLINCGFLDKKPIKFKDMEIVPRDFSLALLGPKLELGEGKDFSLLRVDIKGSEILRYELIDYYKDGATSMVRTTGYPCAIVARMIKDIKGAGVIPPEKLGMDDSIFQQIFNSLSEKEINIKKTYL